jgi:hypothetical protein
LIFEFGDVRRHISINIALMRTARTIGFFFEGVTKNQQWRRMFGAEYPEPRGSCPRFLFSGLAPPRRTVATVLDL